jgi:hypothetical protein
MSSSSSSSTQISASTGRMAEMSGNGNNSGCSNSTAAILEPRGTSYADVDGGGHKEDPTENFRTRCEPTSKVRAAQTAALLSPNPLPSPALAFASAALK